jgi:hypothetical protein
MQKHFFLFFRGIWVLAKSVFFCTSTCTSQSSTFLKGAGADDPEPATRPHLSGVQKNVALHVVVFGLGSVGYLMFHDRWIRGPLRGSLCVFGASPKLDHCASKERFLMGKVAR